MKITLINPPNTYELVGNDPVIIKEQQGIYPPLGILYIAAYLKNTGRYEVTVIDAQADMLDHEQIADRVEEINPDAVGITAMTFTLLDVKYTVKAIRKRFGKTIPIIIGGPHVVIYPEETLDPNGLDADFSVVGEGEMTMDSLLTAISKGDVPEKVWRQTKFIENLDAMIKVVDNYRRRLLSAFEQSRGVEQRISLSARAPQQRKRDTEMLFLVSALALPRDIKTLDKLDESVKVLLTEIKEGKFTRAAALFATPASDELMQAASAEARTVREALVSNKKVVSSGEMTTALSITRQALSKAVKANRFFVLTVGGEDYYPGFFADPDLDRRQLESVSKALGDLPGWEKWRFFTTPKSSLIRLTPLEALKKGMYRQVLTAATGFAER